MRMIVIPALAVGFLSFYGCSKQAEKEAEPVVPVEVTEVRTEPIQRIVRGDGVLRALDQSAIMPKISAPVTRFYVNRGDHVRQGQLLATLEHRDLAAAVADAKGAYQQAAANYRNVSSAAVPDEIVKARSDVQAGRQQLDAAKKLLDSREQLFKQGALARRLVDEASVAYSQANSQYETARKHFESLEKVQRHEEIAGAAGQLGSAKGKYEAAQAQLSYSEVRSPITGVVADRAIFAGEMASAGTPLLTVVDVSNVIARINIPQTEAAHVRVGQSARIAATDGSVESSGKVTVVSPAVDPQSTTVEIWVQAPNPGEKFRPGGTVHVEIMAETIPNAAVVPVAALLPAAEGGSALAVAGPDSIAHLRKAQAGINNGTRVQILAGAKPGERVVISGGVGLEDGAKVRIVQPAGEGGEKKDAGHD